MPYKLPIKTPIGWENFFNLPKVKEQLDIIGNFLNEEINEIYPPSELIYSAFNYFQFPTDIKCIIIGQDPYIKVNQATGLAFSVPKKEKIPPSLRNIFKELSSDGFKPSKYGDLSEWCNKGVFLINTALTVQTGKSGSHMKIWKNFTLLLLEYLNKNTSQNVIIMWGNHAHKYSDIFDIVNHRKIIGVHPSPLSATRGFFGSKPFSIANELLEEMNREKINWNFSD